MMEGSWMSSYSEELLTLILFGLEGYSEVVADL